MSEPLAEARVVIVPDLSKFSAELKAQLQAQIKAVEGATVALSAKAGATTKAAVADRQLAGATLASTESLRLQRVAAAEVANVFGAVATAAKLQTVAVREAAAAQSQFARGAGATGLSLFKVRGATLAAGNEFLIGAAAVTLIAKSIQGASEDTEALFAVTKVLGKELGEGSQKWASSLATSFGIADDAALKFEATLAAVLRNANLTRQEASDFGQKLTEVAADLAAFQHVPVEDTLKAIELAVSGNARSLRKYGVVIQNAEVQQRALQRSGKDSVDELTRQELTLARLSLLFEQANFASGSFAENSGSLANRMKVLSANLDRTSDAVGNKLTPTFSGLVGIINLAILGVDKLKGGIAAVSPPTEDAAGKTTLWGHAWNFFAPAATASLSIISELDKQIESLVLDTPQAAHNVDALTLALEGIVRPAEFAALNLRRLRFEIASLAVSAIDEHLTQLDIVGASSAQRIAALQQKADEARTAVRNAPTVQARRDARETRRQALDEIRSIRAADAADAEAAKSAAEAAAKAAAAAAEKARQQHDQDIQSANARLQFTSDLAHLKAQRTKSLVDDLAADRLELRIINEKIANAHKILDATLKEQTLEGLTLDAERARQQIASERAQIAQNARDRKVAAAEAKVELAGLDADLADTLGHPKERIAALQRQNAALEAEKKLWKGNAVQLATIRNQIAANNKTIREIRKELNDTKSLSAEAQFAFLTTQAGFAANLLGNLIPRGVAAGTVGGTTNAAISTPTGPGPAGFATAAHQRDLTSGVSTAAQVNAGVRGASAGQMSSLISIQRSMLNAILRLTSQRAHPEVTYQQQTQGIDFNVATGT